MGGYFQKSRSYSDDWYSVKAKEKRGKNASLKDRGGGCPNSPQSIAPAHFRPYFRSCKICLSECCLYGGRAGYQISIRSCHEKLHADKIAAYICDGVGGGGGHAKKAGGKILRLKMQEKYGGKSVFEVVEMLLCRYIDEKCVFH